MARIAELMGRYDGAIAVSIVDAETRLLGLAYSSICDEEVPFRREDRDAGGNFYVDGGSGCTSSDDPGLGRDALRRASCSKTNARARAAAARDSPFELAGRFC